MSLVVTLGEALLLVSPAPGSRLVTSETARLSFVGAESNVSIGLARLGHSVRWLSALGNDSAGHRIIRALRGEGVDVSHVLRIDDAPTGLILKDRRPGAEPTVYYYRELSAFSRLTKMSFGSETWRDAKILYLTGITPALSPGCRELFLHLLCDSREHGVKIWLDPNFRGKLWSPADFTSFLLPLLPSVDMLLLGLSEGRILTGAHQPEEVMRSLVERGSGEFVLRSGADGAYYRNANATLHAPAFPVGQVIDPIGAGDAFVTGFISAWIEQRSIEQCLHSGNAVAGLVCQCDGDWEGLPTRHELAMALAGHGDAQR